MPETIRVTLPDGSSRDVAPGTSAREIAEEIGPRLAKAAVAARVSGEVWDLKRPINEYITLEILTD